jgi:ABC-type branched-subunit amino acid transport system permease subunit
MTWVHTIVQGILLGGYFALFATGLSLMFGVMRLVNLAHGSLALAAAFCAVALVNGTGMNAWLTLLIVIPGAAAVGYALQRWLLNATVGAGEVTSVLVTFGLSIIITNLLLQVFSANSQGLQAGAIGTAAIHLAGGLNIGWFDLVTFLVAVTVLSGLQLVMSRTTTGRLMRASSDDPRTALLMGVNTRRVYAVATAIAVATAALAGIFFGMHTQFSPTSGNDALLFGFETVVIGGLGSIWGTLAGGVVLGLAQTIGAQVNPADGVLAGHLVFLLVLAFRPQGLFASGGTPPAAALLHAVRALRGIPRALQAWRHAWQPGSRPRRSAPGEFEPRTDGEVRTVRVRRRGRGSRPGGIGLAAAVVALAALPYATGPNVIFKLVSLFVLIMLASMWNLLAGYGGMISIGLQAFYGLGGYTLLFLANHGVSVWTGIALATLITGVIAVPVSFLAFRLRGGYFAIGTWVISEVIYLIVSQDSSLGGGSGAALTTLSGYDPAQRQADTYWVALVFVVLAVGGVFALLRSRLGLGLIAIRDSETAAGSLGVRVGFAKRVAFGIAALGCGAAGALTLANTLSIAPGSAFDVTLTAYMIFCVIIGGLGTIEGPIIGAAIFFVIQDNYSGSGAWYLIALGALAIVMAIRFRQGIWGLITARTRLSLFPVGYQLTAGAPWSSGRDPAKEPAGSVAENQSGLRAAADRRRRRARLGAQHPGEVFLMREPALDRHLGDRHDARPQQPAGRFRPHPHQEPVRCLSRARLEPPAELADRQRHGGGQVSQRDGLGQAGFHQLPHDRELARGEPRVTAGPGARRPHRMIARELRRQQHGQMIDIGAGGSFPASHDAVQAENELFDERIGTAQLLREFHPDIAVRRLLYRLVGEIDMHGLQVTAELHGQVMGSRVKEKTAGQHAARAAEAAVPAPHRDRAVQVQDQLMRPSRAEARAVRPLGLRGYVEPFPAEASARPHRLDPWLIQDAVGVGQPELRHHDLPACRGLGCRIIMRAS